jgi:hypothetical protein
VPARRRFKVLCRGSRSCAGVPASDGLHRPGSEAGKYVPLSLPPLGAISVPFTLTPYPSQIDILLHQSGHIMLSDFDLAKQSNEPAGMPAMVHSETNGVSVFSCPPCCNSILSNSIIKNNLQIPLIDTMSCTANFRTNSFVGTEGAGLYTRA